MGVARIFKLTTPFTAAELVDVDYEQAADIMYLTHLDHDVQKLSRFDHDVWTMATAVFGATTAVATAVAAVATTPSTGTGYFPITMVYGVTSIDPDSGQESVISATASCVNDLGLDGNYNTISWTPPAGVTRFSVFRKVNGVFGYIGAAEGSSFIDDNISPDFSDSPPTDQQPFAAATDKPGHVTFFEQRAVYGRTKAKPSLIVASQSSDFQNFDIAVPQKASDAITLNLLARRVNVIQHLVPLKVLLVFTDLALFAVSGAQLFLSPNDYKISPEGYRGASRTRPELVDEIAFYVTSKGSAIRTVGFQFESDGYRGNDITVFAPHLFKNFTITALSWAEEPANVIWAVRSDGQVPALTWLKEQDVWGWSLCYTGTDDVPSLIEDCCTITENAQDVTYFVVKRTVGGVVKRFYERMASLTWADRADANYLDCSRTYVGDPATVFSGMSHLAGQTIDVLADGAVISDVEVDASGAFTLAHAASKVIAGLGGEAWIQSLQQPQNMQGIGSTKGRKSSSPGGIVSVIDTAGIEAAPGRQLGPRDPDTSDACAAGEFMPIKTRSTEPYGSPPDLVTGDLEFNLDAGNLIEATVVFRQRNPLPMTITGFSLDLNIGD